MVKIVDDFIDNLTEYYEHDIKILRFKQAEKLNQKYSNLPCQKLSTLNVGYNKADFPFTKIKPIFIKGQTRAILL